MVARIQTIPQDLLTMISEHDNPFGVTKATEFSDNEINEYWVDFNTEAEVSIGAVLKPRELMPKYVIGSKGCGKTHLLRYFSFPLQKIRHDGNITNLLATDGYIGLYSILNGLNSSRFAGKGVDDVQWHAIFEYYFELYISHKLLNTVTEIFSYLQIGKATENAIVQQIRDEIAADEVPDDVIDIASLLNYLTTLRGKIDSQVRNVAFTRLLDFDAVRVVFNPGDLLFGIPAAVANVVPEMNEIKFVYIFDEYEKLFEWQKEFINSLVWEKQMPVTFWIGFRRHGYTTRSTKSGEEMKNGSEFQLVDVDGVIRENPDLYKKFAWGLFNRRLVRFYQKEGSELDGKALAERFKNKFEKYDEAKVIAEIVEKRRKKEYAHFRDFEEKVRRAIKNGLTVGLNEKGQVEQLIEALKDNTDNNPLEQKLKLFYFYFLWHKAGPETSLADIVADVNSEYEKNKAGENSAFNSIRDKRKKDLLAQLSKENNVKNLEFSGLDGVDKFIDLSDGNPRSFILCLKKAIEYATIKGEEPLSEGGYVSLDAQYLAVYDTAKWFYQDVEILGESGRRMYQALRNLGSYLAQERFCDKPVETTVLCFYLKANDLSENATECLNTMLLHFILFEVDKGRPAKTSGVKERLFQLNKTLAPYWGLPTVIRGQVSLNSAVAEATFNPDSAKESFEALFKQRRSQLNAPDFLKYKSTEGQEELFKI